MVEFSGKTVCAWCKKKVKKENGEWVEEVITEDEYNNGTHGICPECTENVRKEYGMEHNKGTRDFSDEPEENNR